MRTPWVISPSFSSLSLSLVLPTSTTTHITSSKTPNPKFHFFIHDSIPPIPNKKLIYPHFISSSSLHSKPICPSLQFSLLLHPHQPISSYLPKKNPFPLLQSCLLLRPLKNKEKKGWEPTQLRLVGLTRLRLTSDCKTLMSISLSIYIGESKCLIYLAIIYHRH